MKIVTKNKLKPANANLAFRFITKNVKHKIAISKMTICHFEMYKLNNFPKGNSEKNQVSCMKIEITIELSQPIKVAKAGIQLNGINAMLNQRMTADNGIAKIFASKK